MVRRVEYVAHIREKRNAYRVLVGNLKKTTCKT
jgi:hypothetical protein